MKKITLAIILASTVVSGCVSMDRNPKIMSSDGVNKWVRERSDKSDFNQGPLKLFVETADAAYPGAETHTIGGNLSNQSTRNPEFQRLFMRRGFALVKDRCRTYFAIKSQRQRSTNLWRDTFAPITALAQGAIGLAGGDQTNSHYLLGLGIATSATNSFFKIYEERFLFSSENVDSVRILVEEALRQDANSKLALADKHMSYINSVDAIVGNQIVCSPQMIMPLVRKAIENGKVVPFVDNTDKNGHSNNEPISESPQGKNAPEGIPRTGVTIGSKS